MLASCQDDSGAHAEALATFASAFKRFPKDPTINFNYAITLSRGGKNEAARDHLRSAIEAAPKQASAYLAYGQVLEADHALGAAVYMYLRFLMFDPRGGCSTGACRKIKELLYRQVDPAKKQIAVEQPKPVTGESKEMLVALNVALATSAATAGSDGSTPSADDTVIHALTDFVQIGHELLQSRDGWAGSFLMSHTIPPLHGLAEAGALRRFLSQVMQYAEPMTQTL